MKHQYVCVVCGYGLDPESNGTWKRVRCWVKNNDRSGSNIRKVEDLFDYAHGACLEKGFKQAENLFG